METPHNTEVEAPGMRPPPVPAGDGPAAPHDRPVPAPPAARVLLATVLALAVGVVTGWVASPALGVPPLRLEVLDHLVTTVRTSLGAPHPAEITRPAENPQPAPPPTGSPGTHPGGERRHGR